MKLVCRIIILQRLHNLQMFLQIERIDQNQKIIDRGHDFFARGGGGRIAPKYQDFRFVVQPMEELVRSLQIKNQFVVRNSVNFARLGGGGGLG